MDSIKRSRPEIRTNERRNSANKRIRDQSQSSFQKKKSTGNAIILDNGAYSLKIGASCDPQPKNIPNHIMKAKSERKRFFIGDQIEDCRDLSGLFYIIPHDHGYITKFDVQKTIWDYAFNKVSMDDSTLIMTQPIFNFRHVQEYMDEIFFEEYDVKTLFRANPTDLARYQYVTEYKGADTPCVVVDSGYSFTHIVPYINGKKYAKGIIRLDIGGKLLTNYLKDILSYRQLHVMEETYVINQVKEDTCFMSQDFKKDMNRAKNTSEIVKNYVLPDFHNIRRGFVQDTKTSEDLAENCQILKLNNERISVPEVLMRPSIIPGLEQAGLAQCISNSISKCPEKYRRHLSDNVILIGGNCLFPGYKERVELDTRMFLPSHHRLSIYQPESPVNYAWLGGRTISSDSDLHSMYVTKQNYEEYGSSYVYKKFNEFCVEEVEKPKKMEREPFSYLKHWKDEGVDIFNKNVMVENPSDSDVVFILEGDGIEEYDGKYLTVEFEYEKSKLPEKVINVVEEVKKIEEKPKIEEPPQLRLIKKKKSIMRPDITSLLASTSTISYLPTKIIKTSPDSGFNSPSTLIPSTSLVLNNVLTESALAKQAPKVYKPIFRAKQETKVGEPPKIGQILTLANPITLNGKNILVPTSSTKTVTLNSGSLLSNRMILPQNLLNAKNLTLQIIPFKPEMLRQGGNIIITKKP